MFLSIKSIVLSALLANSLVAAGSKSPVKYTATGYDAYVYAGFDSCSSNFYSSLSASVWGSQSKFKATTSGSNDGKVASNSYESMWVSLDLVESCSSDGMTVDFLTGSVWESSYSGNAPKFTIESKKLSQAIFEDIPVPMFRHTCTYECMEICYAEIWEYGTCPPEEPYLECWYSSCTDYEEAGTATVNIQWTDNSNTALVTHSSSYRSKDPRTGSYSLSRTKGSYRYIDNMAITAVLDGSSLVSQASYTDGQLSKTSEKSISKYGSSY